MGPEGSTYSTGTIPLTDADDTEIPEAGGARAAFNAGTKEVVLDWPQCPPVGVLYFQVQVNESVPQGATISNSIRADYSLLEDDMTRPYVETSNSATATVDYHPGVLLSPDTSGSGNPGDKMYYPFIVTNTGNAPDTIDLTYNSSFGWSWVIWHDVDGNGIPGTDGDVILTDTNASGIIDTGILPQDGSLALIAVATIPAGTSDGSVETTVIKGVSSIDPAVTSAVTMTTTVKAPLLSVSKALVSVQAPEGGAVCIPTDPTTGAGCTYVPGSALTYRITVVNNGTGNATSVVITDVIPAYTTYRAGSIRTGWNTGSLTPRTDGNDGDGGRYEGGAVIAGGSGNLTLGPEGTWVLEFGVTID